MGRPYSDHRRKARRFADLQWTLVVHGRDDPIIPFDEGRIPASVVPGAQCLPLPTGTHDFPVTDEVTHRLVDAIRQFVATPP